MPLAISSMTIEQSISLKNIGLPTDLSSILGKVLQVKVGGEIMPDSSDRTFQCLISASEVLPDDGIHLSINVQPKKTTVLNCADQYAFASIGIDSDGKMSLNGEFQGPPLYNNLPKRFQQGLYLTLEAVQ